MFEYINSMKKTLLLASVLTLTGGVSVAQGQPGGGPPDGEPPRMGQQDGEHGPRGPQADRRERGPRDEAGPHGPHGPGDIARRLFAGMELTDAQKAEIEEIMIAHGDERKAWHEAHQEELQALREQMREAHEAKDKEAIDATRKQVQELMESAPKPDATHDQIRALLTEDQQKIFDERIEKMRRFMEQRRQGGPDAMRRPGGRLFGNLNMSDEQKVQLREIMQSDQTREEKIEAVKQILTEEQQAKLQENLEKMKQMRQRRGEDGPRGNRGDRGPRGGQGGPPPPPPPPPHDDDDQLDLDD